MVRAWHFANVAACRWVRTPLGAGFSKKYHIVFLGILFRCCVLGGGTLPSQASLDSGVNEYLIGQRW